MTVGEFLALLDKDDTVIYKLNYQEISYETLLEHKNHSILSINISAGLKQFEVYDITTDDIDYLFEFMNTHNIPKESYRAVTYINILV